MTELPYHLYGLIDGNPYVHQPLDPLKRPADRRRLLGLDGFVNPGPLLSYLEQAAADKEPAFVLIGGRNLTGRTSLANWVLDRYFELRQVDQRYLPVRVQVADHDEFRWLRKAIAQLWARINRAGDLELNEAVADSIKQDLFSITNSMDYQEMFQVSLEDLSIELAERKNPYAFGVVFEGVRSPGFVAAAQTVFEGSAAVIVFTYDDYEHAQTTDAQGFRAQQFEDIMKVYLEPLAGRQVCLLASGRWEQASTEECPFDADGLSHLYQNRITPIKAALKRLEDLLDYRLELGPHDAAWPANEHLFMDRRWLASTFKLVEKSS